MTRSVAVLAGPGRGRRDPEMTKISRKPMVKLDFGENMDFGAKLSNFPSGRENYGLVDSKVDQKVLYKV